MASSRAAASEGLLLKYSALFLVSVFITLLSFLWLSSLHCCICLNWAVIVCVGTSAAAAAGLRLLLERKYQIKWNWLVAVAKDSPATQHVGLFKIPVGDFPRDS